jgi:hypothetical protein
MSGRAGSLAILKKTLERKKNALLSQQQALLVIRQKLLLQHSLLTAWCEALTLLQEHGQLQQLAAADYDPDVQAQFQQLLHSEIILLGELTCIQQPSSCSVDPGPDALSPGGCNSSNRHNGL